jgi:hypothetical protein
MGVAAVDADAIGGIAMRFRDPYTVRLAPGSLGPHCDGAGIHITVASAI